MRVGRLLHPRVGGALAVTPVLALVLATGPWPAAPASRPTPVTPIQTQVSFLPAAAATGRAAGPSEAASPPDVTAVSPAVGVAGLRVVGATWRAGSGEDAIAEYRVKGSRGWSPWAPLPVEDDHAPDPGSPEAAQLRPGTDPLVVTADSSAVQLRLRGPRASAPADASLTVVDPRRSLGDATAGVPAAGSAQAVPSTPPILSRADWGADETLKPCCTEYGRVRIGFVHHTVSSNTYAAADVPAIIRGIYSFHVTSRGYRDIGYNFLVDRFGRIWEGRFGGVSRAVVGAQTYGYNSESFGMSAIGDFETSKPGEAVIDAFARLFAWKLGIHGVPVNGSTSVGGVNLANISGHRDANSTACPGRNLYARLPDIRSLAVGYQGGWADSSPRRTLDDRQGPDLVLDPGSGTLATASGSGAEITGAVLPLSGPGWLGYARVLATPDFDGDRRPDLLGYDANIGVLFLHSGDGRGGLVEPRRSLGVGWQAFDLLAAAGDLSGDGRADLVARDAAGRLWLYRGDGKGWFTGSPTALGAGWTIIDRLVGGSDWDGDGGVDLVGREASTGRLWLYRGSGAGGIVERTPLAGSWGPFDAFAAPGDWDGDGRADLLAREKSSGVLWLYADAGAGTWYPQARSLGTGWNTVDQLVAAGDFDGDGRADVAARGRDRMWLYPGDGPDLLRTAVATSATVPLGSQAFVAGDFSGDGRPDVLAVDPATGRLLRFAGNGAGGLAPHVAINAGWDTLRSVGPAGDFDNDGFADLLGIGVVDNRLRLYRGDGAGGFLGILDLGGDWSAVDAVLAVGPWDGDGAADLVSRDRNTGDLRLHPGNGPGNLLPAVVVNRGWSGFDILEYVGDLDASGWPDLVARVAGSDTLLLYPGGPGGRIYPARQLRVPGVPAASQLRSVG